MGSVADLQRGLTRLNLAVLDTMVLSYHLSAHPRYSTLTTIILNAVETGQLTALVTTVTLAELLTAPAQVGNRQAMREYELFLLHFPNMQLVDLSTSLARETALVRAETGLRTPDAIQVATARCYEADALLTNGLRWKGKVQTPRLLMLDDYLA